MKTGPHPPPLPPRLRTPSGPHLVPKLPGPHPALSGPARPPVSFSFHPPPPAIPLSAMKHLFFFPTCRPDGKGSTAAWAPGPPTHPPSPPPPTLPVPPPFRRLFKIDQNPPPNRKKIGPPLTLSLPPVHPSADG